MLARKIGLFVPFLLGSCSQGNQAETYTLYRNSNVDYALRMHWATFNADQPGDYNRQNCLMAARLLNANVTALARANRKTRDSNLGFWCESGFFKKNVRVPNGFLEQFPTGNKLFWQDFDVDSSGSN